jgi:hypothetical protein
LLFRGFAQTPPPSRSQRPVIPFQEDAKRGLHWAGLRTPQAGSKCAAKLLEVTDSHGKSQGCTHGPDPTPEGVDATVSVAPLDNGTGTPIPTSANGIACDGDGVTGDRVQMIYVHASDVADRYSQFAGSFQQYTKNLNDLYVQSGQENGGTARYIRFVTDSNCNVPVPDVTLTSTGDDNMNNTMSELRAQGYNRADRKYVLWVDANVYCGLGMFFGDDQPGPANVNNIGPMFARVDSACWGGPAEAHELGHTLGAVNYSAPHTTGGAHCNDANDRMCYNDGGPTGTQTYPCPNRSPYWLDCNHDDYFNTGQPADPTSYIATHWNLANSMFLIVGPTAISQPAPTPTPTPTPPPPPASPITITITSPLDGSEVTTYTKIVASATDTVSTVSKISITIDGVLIKSLNRNNISYNWYTRRASIGTHNITITAYDKVGNIAKKSVLVNK